MLSRMFDEKSTDVFFYSVDDIEDDIEDEIQGEYDMKYHEKSMDQVQLYYDDLSYYYDSYFDDYNDY